MRDINVTGLLAVWWWKIKSRPTCCKVSLFSHRHFILSSNNFISMYLDRIHCQLCQSNSLRIGSRSRHSSSPRHPGTIHFDNMLYNPGQHRILQSRERKNNVINYAWMQNNTSTESACKYYLVHWRPLQVQRLQATQDCRKPFLVASSSEKNSAYAWGRQLGTPISGYPATTATVHMQNTAKWNSWASPIWEAVKFIGRYYHWNRNSILNEYSVHSAGDQRPHTQRINTVFMLLEDS